MIRPMSKCFGLACLVATLSLPSTAKEITPGLLTVVGNAYDLSHGELLYREMHYALPSGSDYQVIYQAPDGETIAQKDLSFNGNDNQPAMEQTNSLCGEFIKVDHATDEDKISVTYREKADKKTKEKTFRIPKRLVVDAGFDNFVRENWDELVSGQKFHFDFLAPSRLRAYDFEATAIECQREGNLRCFQIESDVWYLDAFLDPIVLTYTADTRQLMGFTGLGNIADKQCDYMKVDIHYEYPNSNL